MIKSTELRKGNYIEVDGVIAPVEAVGYEKIAVNGKYWQEDQVYPVDLTEEILLKCGFKKEYNWFYFGKISIGIELDRMTSELHDGISYNQYPIPKYLHRLQNIYFELENNELTINI